MSRCLISVLVLLGISLAGCPNPADLTPPKKSYSLHYYANGASGTEPASHSVAAGGNATVKGPGTLVKPGWTFLSWNTKADGKGTVVLIRDEVTLQDASLSLYAQWTNQPTFTVTYDGNGNTGGTVPVDENHYLANSSVKARTHGTLVKSGFLFQQWNTTVGGDGTSYPVPGSITIGATNLTVFAQWKILSSSGTQANRFFWGYWTRMDQDESWYISDTGVKKGTASSLPYSSVPSDSQLTVNGYTLAKQTDNVLMVNDGAFYLYRKAGASGTLTGMVSAGSGGLSASLARGIEDTGKFNVKDAKLKIRNLNNPKNTTEITANPEVAFTTAAALIPGDTYEVSTTVTNADGTSFEGPVVMVTPQSTSDSLGTIVLTQAAYNFKVAGDAGSGYLYAGSSFATTVTVKNIGTGNSFGTSFTLPSQDAGVSVNTNTAAVLGTINAGASKTIALTVSVADFAEDYRDVVVKVNIKDVNNGVWPDSVTLRVYKKPMTYSISSINLPVYGIILSPEKQGTFFTTTGTGVYKTTTVTLPWRQSGYLLAFSRASADTETAYSVGLETPAAVQADFTTFLNNANSPSVFEPNNTEDQAAGIALNETVTSYLHSTDVDFFSVGGKANRPVASLASGTYDSEQSVTLTTPTAGAEIRYTVDGTAPTASSSVFSAALPITKTTVLKAMTFKSSLAASNELSANYELKVKTPTVTVASGGWTLACATAGAAIHYTTDGTDPSAASALSTGAVVVGSPVKAIALKTGWTTSAIGASSGAPVPAFTASPASVNNPSSFDASATTDDDSTANEIQVRWDYGTGAGWTAWSTVKTSSFTYTTVGTYTVKLEAKDKFNVPASTTKSVAVASYFLSNFVMKDVAGGTFNNGTSNVTLSGFKMSATEITQAQYVAVTGTNPSYFTGDTTRPVERVTWYDGVEFCNLLSAKEGLSAVYAIASRSPATGYPITSASVTQDLTKNGYRLPTEAEWEWAGRGATLTHGYTYAGSNVVGDVAWYSDNAGSTSHPVATKAANELGLFDMTGNVWEWCWDWYSSSYASAAQTDPKGSASGTYRVNRGGSWSSTTSGSTVAYRYTDYPNNRSSSVGFRVARSIPVAMTGLTFTLGTLQNLTFTPAAATVDVESSLVLSPGNAALASSGTHWRWYLDGALVSAQSGNTFTLDTHGLWPGSYSVNVLVDYQGLQYSGSINVTVKG